MQREDMCKVVLTYFVDEYSDKATVQRLRRVFRQLKLNSDKIDAIFSNTALDAVDKEDGEV